MNDLDFVFLILLRKKKLPCRNNFVAPVSDTSSVDVGVTHFFAQSLVSVKLRKQQKTVPN